MKADLHRFRLVTLEERRLAVLGCCFFALAILFHVLAASEREITDLSELAAPNLMLSDGRMAARGWSAETSMTNLQLPP